MRGDRATVRVFGSDGVIVSARQRLDVIGADVHTGSVQPNFCLDAIDHSYGMQSYATPNVTGYTPPVGVVVRVITSPIASRVVNFCGMMFGSPRLIGQGGLLLV